MQAKCCNDPGVAEETSRATGQLSHPHEVLAFNLGQRRAARRGRERVGITGFAKGQPERIRDQQKSNFLNLQHIPERLYNYGSAFRLQAGAEVHYLTYSE